MEKLDLLKASVKIYCGLMNLATLNAEALIPGVTFAGTQPEDFDEDLDEKLEEAGVRLAHLADLEPEQVEALAVLELRESLDMLWPDRFLQLLQTVRELQGKPAI